MKDDSDSRLMCGIDGEDLCREVRWPRQRRYTGNNLLSFMHARLRARQDKTSTVIKCLNCASTKRSARPPCVRERLFQGHCAVGPFGKGYHVGAYMYRTSLLTPVHCFLLLDDFADNVVPLFISAVRMRSGDGVILSIFLHNPPFQKRSPTDPMSCAGHH